MLKNVRFFALVAGLVAAIASAFGAHVTGGLFSMTASGAFGKAMVFDKRGYVRKFVSPANPKSHDQGDARQKMAAAQAAIALLGSTAKTAVKAVAPTGYRWASFLVQRIIGTGAGTWSDMTTEWGLLTSPQKSAWDSAAAAIVLPVISYKAMSTPSEGECMYALARALYKDDMIVTPGTPDGTNAAAWASAIQA